MVLLSGIGPCTSCQALNSSRTCLDGSLTACRLSSLYLFLGVFSDSLKMYCYTAFMNRPATDIMPDLGPYFELSWLKILPKTMEVPPSTRSPRLVGGYMPESLAQAQHAIKSIQSRSF